MGAIVDDERRKQKIFVLIFISNENEDYLVVITKLILMTFP